MKTNRVLGAVWTVTGCWGKDIMWTSVAGSPYEWNQVPGLILRANTEALRTIRSLRTISLADPGEQPQTYTHTPDSLPIPNGETKAQESALPHTQEVGSFPTHHLMLTHPFTYSGRNLSWAVRAPETRDGNGVKTSQTAQPAVCADPEVKSTRVS